ncbi:MAG: TRL-like family protein [Alphaproteobacteria bacterium]|nr:TRL-like family protein [Alphaproteobacteria bacterium]
MKKLLIILPMLLCGCVSTPVMNNTDLGKVDFEKLLNSRQGKACQSFILGFIPFGPGASVAKAAWSVGIKKVEYVEYITVNAFPIVIQSCVKVYGT